MAGNKLPEYKYTDFIISDKFYKSGSWILPIRHYLGHKPVAMDVVSDSFLKHDIDSIYLTDTHMTITFNKCPSIGQHIIYYKGIPF